MSYRPTPIAMNHVLSALALTAALLGAGCSGPVAEPAHPESVAATPASAGRTSADRQTTPTGAIDPEEDTMRANDPTKSPAADGRELASFGAGCFWCTEAVLEQLDGVIDVKSGYMGGSVENPTYEQVCTGRTGHAEIVQVTFDPAKISYEHLLEWFWKLHDPTTLNRQGNDEGPQYRSVIFYHSEAQRLIAEASKGRAQTQFLAPIVTEISPASTFYPAEDYHQDFYAGNRSYGYCRAIIAPKLDKLGLKK